jgi:hypothetical protein
MHRRSPSGKIWRTKILLELQSLRVERKMSKLENEANEGNHPES